MVFAVSSSSRIQQPSLNSRLSFFFSILILMNIYSRVRFNQFSVCFDLFPSSIARCVYYFNINFWFTLGVVIPALSLPLCPYFAFLKLFLLHSFLPICSENSHHNSIAALFADFYVICVCILMYNMWWYATGIAHCYLALLYRCFCCIRWGSLSLALSLTLNDSSNFR